MLDSMIVDRRLLIGKPGSNTLDALERSADDGKRLELSESALDVAWRSLL